MEYIIIKMYVNEKHPDLYDYELGILDKLADEMRTYASESGRRLCFASMTAMSDGLPYTIPFAEVEYTGELSSEEKAKYVAYLKRFSHDTKDMEKDSGRATLELVRFSKIDDEIFDLR